MNRINQKTKIIIIVIAIIVICVVYYLYQKNENNIIIENISENTKSNISNEINYSEKNAEKIMVYISGAVNSPGVIEIKNDMRVKDAIELANGLKDNADLTNINLAEKLQDECKIYIPEKGDNNDENSSQNIANMSIKNETRRLININTANSEELKTLPGIGQATAERIIEYRKKNGKFNKIEDLKNIRGIGDTKFEEIKDYISV